MFGEIKTKIKQCQVIWVFGESGAGKTVWTDKYLNSWKER